MSKRGRPPSVTHELNKYEFALAKSDVQSIYMTKIGSPGKSGGCRISMPLCEAGQRAYVFVVKKKRKKSKF